MSSRLLRKIHFVISLSFRALGAADTVVSIPVQFPVSTDLSRFP